MENLRGKSVHAGLANVSGQVGRVLIKILSTMILARLLAPSDYGLIAMATTFTGFLGLFSSLGLYHATIQCDSISLDQSSTLFWIVLLIGFVLFILCIALSPAIALFYGDPNLISVTIIIGTGFIFSGAGIQHGALLSRQMRYGTSALIDISSEFISTAAAIYLALIGYGYYALAFMIVLQPLVATIGLWCSTRWFPTRPRFSTQIAPMLRFGRAMTLTSAVTYIANNLQKVLIGKFWGEEAIGLYGRGSYLISFPIDTLNNAIGEVAFNALSKVKRDAARLRRSFLQIYTCVVALTLPITTACALFADDVIAILLGPNWSAVVPIFRLLTPAVLVFAINSPIGWLLSALGMADRGLKIALISAPLLLLAVMAGLPYGPNGVALSYSAIMLLKAAPVTAWALRGTGIHFRDVFTGLRGALTASVIAGIISYTVKVELLAAAPPFVRLALVVALFSVTYVVVLLRSTTHKAVISDVLQTAKSLGIDPRKLGFKSAA
ncbi:lipopolysaccharide biosynthesis protein [Bosea sp. F3-2]|uniref:lipopolysaccharide biosynthesis protein n=1 Tax=Bosea sp. F3-2 TaxID=2599640 RepID=UPI0011EDBED9|nr:lipopolysaccharide biosynthesis protein [Bosea sp. F3-2]QEL24133.1 lipopolysaccharide biosynthesis protein [Bosea sp. F3-2]